MATVAEARSVAEALYEKRALAQLAVRRAQREFVTATVERQAEATASLKCAREACRVVEDEYDDARKRLREAVKADLDVTLAAIRNGSAA